MKALVSVFFLFSSSLPDLAIRALAPKPLLPCGSTSVRLPLLSCLAQSLPLAPAVNLTCARQRLWFKLTAGPLLRGIQAVLQELAGSATGGRGRGMPVICRTARSARGYPPATLAALVIVRAGLHNSKSVVLLLYVLTGKSIVNMPFFSSVAQIEFSA